MTNAEGTELTTTDIAGLRALIRTGATTPEAVLDACLDRITRDDGAVRSFLTADADDPR
jgi:Asp-tRNA(Asn)/Glu-tRNA(Gln) amidotransferase A subunit family amidase